MDAQALQQRIYEWNSLHLDLFEITLLKEVRTHCGVIRFHLCDDTGTLSTRCTRVLLTTMTSEVVEQLMEKFKLDTNSRTVSLARYALYELHTNREERMLADDECPLIAQLNWTRGDGIFVLKNERNKLRLDKAVIKELCQQQLKPGASGKVKDKAGVGGGEGGKTLQRTPSKKSSAACTPSDTVSSPFARSSSNPDYVTQHRRQQQKVQFTDNFNPGPCRSTINTYVSDKWGTLPKKPQDKGQEQQSNGNGGSNQIQLSVLTLPKINNSLGLTITSIVNDHGERGTYVKSITASGAAAQDGRLLVGDQLVEANGVSLIGISQEEAVATLRASGDVVTLYVARRSTNEGRSATRRVKPQSVDQAQLSGYVPADQLQTPVQQQPQLGLTSSLTCPQLSSVDAAASLAHADDTFAYAMHGSDKSFSFPFRIHTAPTSDALPIMAWGQDVASPPLPAGGIGERQPIMHHVYPSPYPEPALVRAESDHQFRTSMPMHSAKSAFKSVVQTNNGSASSSSNGIGSLPKYLRKELSREEDVPTAIPVAGPVPPPPPPRTTLPLPAFNSLTLHDLPSPDLPPPPPELLFSPDQHSKPFEVAANRPTTLNLSEIPLKSHSNHKVLTRAQSNPLSIANSAATAASSVALPSPPDAFAVETSPYLYPYAPVPAPVTVVMDNSTARNHQHKTHQRTSSVGDGDSAVPAAAKSLADIMVASKPLRPAPGDAAVRKSSLTETAVAGGGVVSHKPPRHPSVTSSAAEPAFSSSSSSSSSSSARSNNTSTTGGDKRPPVIPSKPTRNSIINYQQVTCALQLQAAGELQQQGQQGRCADEDLAMASYAGIHVNSPLFQDARFTVSSVRF